MSNAPETPGTPEGDFIRLILEVGSVNAIAVAMESYENHYNALYDKLQKELRDLIDQQTALEEQGKALMLKALEPFTNALSELPKVYEGRYQPLVISNSFPIDTRGFSMETFSHVTVQIRQVVTQGSHAHDAWMLSAPVLLTPEMQELQVQYSALVRYKSKYYKDMEEITYRLKPDQLALVKRQAEASLGRVALNQTDAGRQLLERLSAVKPLPGAKPLLTVKE